MAFPGASYPLFRHRIILLRAIARLDMIEKASASPGEGAIRGSRLA
jgi:hypothetical protein